jgi:predicted nucleotidyltransferase
VSGTEEPKDRLARAAEIDDVLDRRMFALAVVTSRLSEVGVKPVLVGGGAVQFYTLGGYATKDIDVVMPTSEPIEAAMAELGFERQGRYWIREDIDIVIEAPSSSLAEGFSRVVRVQVDDMPVYVLGLEDLIIDRLNAYKHWKSAEDGRWAGRLIALGGDNLDREYLAKRAEEEMVSDALSELSADGSA